MLNFTFHAPTRIFFGKDQLTVLGDQILSYGRNILIVYGKGSIKKNGLYDAVVAQLRQHGITFYELGGVDPNPRIATVREGAELCRRHQVQLVLAIGGGSAIDCAKGIALAACYAGDPWDFWLGKAQINEALPVGSILTLAATGSEMNWGSVITNETTEDKRGKGHPLLIPKFAILDPTYTYTVPPLQTAAGVADIMSHIFEYYFSPVTSAFLQDSFAEAVMRTCLKYGPVACQEPDNYEARANLMWASSMALNGVVARGKTFDGTLHGIEHVISGLYDLTHGIGLAILAPSWLEYILGQNQQTQPKIAQLGRNIWGIDDPDNESAARESIQRLRQFYRSLNLPLSFHQVGIGSERFPEIARKSVPNETLGVFNKLTHQDVLEILNQAR